MKILDVNIYNEDGDVQATVKVSEKEMAMLMEFSVNFLLSVGVVAVSGGSLDMSKLSPKLND